MYFTYISRKQLGKGAVFLLCLIILWLGFLGVYQNKNVPVSDELAYKPIYQGDINKKNMALTFNIDWGEEFIDDIIDILQKEQVTATFYPTGKWAAKFPDKIKLIHENGHELGNHGYSHPHVNQLSLEENKQEIIKTELILKEICGVKTQLYAPPYGEDKPHVMQAAEELGYKVVFWTIDTVDWKKEVTVAQIHNKVLGKAQNGAIVLMHPTANTVTALPEMIKGLKDKGFSLSSVSDIL
ncbi:MAG: polysaccharide deacetylase family protein [Bacillota bacterium]